MLFFGTKLNEISLFSVRSAGRIGSVEQPIINPHNLHIDGFYVNAMNGQNCGIILDMDIREFILKGIIINNHEDISSVEDLVRLKSIIELDFKLLDKAVYQNNSRIGKVSDFVVDGNSLFVQKLYVSPSLLKSFGSNEFIFDRQSILEVTDTKIVVKGPEEYNTKKVVQRFGLPSFNSSNTSTITEYSKPLDAK